jgi:endonuclease YncB( thermonuclease family)
VLLPLSKSGAEPAGELGRVGERLLSDSSRARPLRPHSAFDRLFGFKVPAVFAAGAVVFLEVAFLPSPSFWQRCAISRIVWRDHTLIGRAAVIDGDTIEISGQRIRFNGIDAPEAAQLCSDRHGKSYRCGAESARALEGLLAASRPTECRFVERDQYGRFVGDCFRADGQNVAALLVRSGQALDWPKHSGGAYATEQRSAQAQRIGLWRGKFVEPWKWRAEQRQKPQVASQRPVGLLSSGDSASDGCRIKGNINSKGERIYHTPGQEYYERTSINVSKGERWFCSEDEARAAGWRRARR